MLKTLLVRFVVDLLYNLLYKTSTRQQSCGVWALQTYSNSVRRCAGPTRCARTDHVLAVSFGSPGWQRNTERCRNLLEFLLSCHKDVADLIITISINPTNTKNPAVFRLFSSRYCYCNFPPHFLSLFPPVIPSPFHSICTLRVHLFHIHKSFPRECRFYSGLASRFDRLSWATYPQLFSFPGLFRRLSEHCGSM